MLPRDEQLTEPIAAREEARPVPPDVDRRIRRTVEECVRHVTDLVGDPS